MYKNPNQVVPLFFVVKICSQAQWKGTQDKTLKSVSGHRSALTKQGSEQQELRQWDFKRGPTQPSQSASNSVPLTLELVLAMFEALRHCDPEATAMYSCIHFWLCSQTSIQSSTSIHFHTYVPYLWLLRIFLAELDFPRYCQPLRYTKARSCPTSTLCLSAKMTAEVSQLSFLSFQSACPPFPLLPAHLSSYFRFPNRPFCLQSPFSNLECKQGCLFPA